MIIPKSTKKHAWFGHHFSATEEKREQKKKHVRI